MATNLECTGEGSVEDYLHQYEDVWKPEHQAKILDAYQNFNDQPGFAAVVTNEDTLVQGGNLSVPRHVKKVKKSKGADDSQSLTETWTFFEDDGRELWTGMDSLLEMLDGVVAEEASDA